VRYYRQAFVAVLALAAALRCCEALRRPLDVDEGLSLSIAARPIADELHFLRVALDVHPPLAFIFVHILTVAHFPIWAMHVVMAGIGVLSVALLMAIVARWSSGAAAIVAGSFAACMPSLVLYDGWIRMYPVYDALVLASFWLLTLLAQPLAARARPFLWAGWTIASAAAAYTLYLAWPAIAAQAVYALTRSVRFAGALAAAACVAFVLWLPQLPTFFFQIHIGGGLTFGGLQADLAHTLWQLPSQATVDPHVEGLASELAAAAVWLWAAASFAAAWRAMRATILPWLTAPGVVTIAVSLVLHKYLYLDRYYLLDAYALAAWTGVAAVSLAQQWRPAWFVTAALGAATAAAGIVFAVDPAFYTADWPHVARVLAARALPSDVIIFEQGPGYWAFSYYQGAAHYQVWQVSTPDEIDAAIAHVDAHPRVWLIGNSLRGIDPQLRLLRHLQMRYHLAYFEESVRALPSEDVEIGLFVREPRR